MFSSATTSVNGTDWKNASVQVRGRRERGERERERERGGRGGETEEILRERGTEYKRRRQSDKGIKREEKVKKGSDCFVPQGLRSVSSAVQTQTLGTRCALRSTTCRNPIALPASEDSVIT